MNLAVVSNANNIPYKGPYFSSSEIQFKMETEFKLFSATHHLYCTTRNNFFAHIKSKIGGTWQIFFSSDSKPLNLVFSRDIKKRKVKAFNADKMVDYFLIREKKIVGGIIRDIQNEITQNNDLKENSRNNFDPTPCKSSLFCMDRGCRFRAFIKTL